MDCVGRHKAGTAKYLEENDATDFSSAAKERRNVDCIYQEVHKILRKTRLIDGREELGGDPVSEEGQIHRAVICRRQRKMAEETLELEAVAPDSGSQVRRAPCQEMERLVRRSLPALCMARKPPPPPPPLLFRLPSPLVVRPSLPSRVCPQASVVSLFHCFTVSRACTASPCAKRTTEPSRRTDYWPLCSAALRHLPIPFSPIHGQHFPLIFIIFLSSSSSFLTSWDATT